MARINIVNADNKIDATPQRAYFKLKQTGGPKGEKGDTGERGPIGPQGPQGASASVSVNSTTTLPAGSSATVENIGTAQNVKLNFGIPTGPQGPQGEQGPQGAQGPQGLKGDTGAKGADGAAAKVTVGNTNTGAAGTNASVENTGSETYAVLNFTIPRGDKGETGPMPDIAQTTGQATDEVMSQKATTDALATKQNNLTAGTGITIASDTVSADTAVLATKADLDDYAPQATTYTKAEADALLAQKLEAEVVAELPTTGEEGKLYLTPKAHTTSTATGNPITATVTEEAGALESFQLDGNTFQQSYTGKNCIGFQDQEERTVNGLTYSIKDGIVTVNGTATSTTYTDSSTLFNFKEAGDITLSIEILGGTQSSSIIGFQNRNSQTAQLRWQQVGPSSGLNNTKAIDAQTISDTTDIRLYMNLGSVFNNFKFRLMAEYGSTATDYEPYVGGQPSPNPSYPQPIQTVTGEQTVTVVGKNLFSNTGWQQGQYSNGVWGGGNNQRATTGFIPVKTDTYTATINDGKSDASFININCFDSSMNWLGARDYLGLETFADTDISKTFTIPSGVAYIRITIRPYGTATTEMLPIAPNTKLMLELGSTASAYAPYHATSYPINLGKNLISASWESGRYNNSTGVKEPYSDNVRTDSPIPVQPNTTYICSRNGSGVAMNILEYKADGSFIRATTISSGNSFTTGADTYFVTMFRGTPGGTEGIQLEIGSTITAYAPYFTPIELCKLGDYQDYIWKDGEDWKVHKATTKKELVGEGNTFGKSGNSSNNSFYYASNANTGHYVFSDIDTAPLGGSATSTIVPNAACNAFIVKSPSATVGTNTQGATFDYVVNTNVTELRLGFGLSSTITSTALLRGWLDTNKPIFYYGLATPTDTTITDQTLIAQLEAIRTAALENGTNTITNSAAGSNLAGDMEITYYGYNPTNRYDKFIWLDLNNSYEQIGG